MWRFWVCTQAYPGKLFKEIFSLHKLGQYIIFCCFFFQVITEYVYKLLQSDDIGLKKLEIPQEKRSSTFSFAKQVR